MTRFALLALIVAFGSCAEINGTQPPPVPSDLGSYFWPMQSATYHYRESDSTLRTVTLTASGTHYDISDSSERATPTYVADANGGSVEIADLRPDQLFPLPPGYMLVKDTSATEAPLIPTALLTVRTGLGKAMTIVISHDSCYWLQPNGALNGIGTLPRNDLAFLAGGQNLGDPIVALSNNGDLAYSTDLGRNWVMGGYKASQRIVGIAANEDLYVATAQTVYRIEDLNKPWKQVVSANSPASITAIAPAGDHDFIIGTNLGDVVRPNGGGSMNGKRIPGAVTAICAESNGDVLASAQGDIYEFDKGMWRLRQSVSSEVTALLADDVGLACYATKSGDVGVLGFPTHAMLPAPVTAIYPVANDIAAIAGDSLYLVHSNDQFTSVHSEYPRRQLEHGTLTLLKNGDSTWVAGAIAQAGATQRKSFVYTAHVMESGVQLQLGDVFYDNILIVHYTPTSADGVVDMAIPDYTVYYQHGQGPVRVESIGGGPPHTSTRTAR